MNSFCVLLDIKNLRMGVITMAAKKKKPAGKKKK